MRHGPVAGGPELGLDVRLEARAVPGVLRALHLVPMVHGAIVAEIERVLVDNPVLERAGPVCPNCGRQRPLDGCQCCGFARSGSGPEPTVRPFDSLEVQAGHEIRTDCRSALPIVIGHLTARGLLDCDPVEIAASSGLPSAAVDEALRAIKVVGLAGIAERTVGAMLAVQAQGLVDAGIAAPWLVNLVRDHLPQLADGDAAAAAAELGVDPAQVAAALNLVRTRLRPLALADDGAPPAPLRPVDVVVDRTRSGELVVEVPDSRWFGLRIAAVPPELVEHADAVSWLGEHERAARSLLHQLDTRASVLRAVAVAAVRRQVRFFDAGPVAHAPLTRADVALELGLHPSTVSRAVTGKAVRCPDGQVIALAELFGGAVAVKALVADLLADRPRSDAQISRALAAVGHRVARRTVAKYRAELGIGVSSPRRS